MNEPLRSPKTEYKRMAVFFLCLTGSTGMAQIKTAFEAMRLNDGNPVVTREHFQEAGAPAREGANINGPSVIRVPSWIPVQERAAADANYYMYFAHHKGEYIRMAHAPTPLGPWRLFNVGEGSGQYPGRGVLDLKAGDSAEIDTGAFRVRHHVASPDARVDHENRRVVLYFHAPAGTKRQETFVATSRYGLNFNQPKDGGEKIEGVISGVRDVIPGRFYFRTFEVGGTTFAYANQAELYRAPGETAAGEAATLANADEPGGLWMPGPGDSRAEYWELIADEHNPIRRIYRALGRKVSDPRHFAVLHDPRVHPDRIYILYTSKGDEPERILLTEIDLTGLTEKERTDPARWGVVEPRQRVLLEPEETWEGADLPLAPSRSSAATGVRELRDPYLLRDDDGKLYLYYAGRGEEAIGVASLTNAGGFFEGTSLPYQKGELLFRDDFRNGMNNWVPELQAGGTVEVEDGRMIIDVPAGCTVWFTPLIEGPVMIEYEATVIDAGGPNDRVSDLNCFWMASDSRSPADIFGQKRSGQFSDYHQLECYYVGLGGHANTRTRFRRYIGDAEERPLLPEHDLSNPEVLIQPNVRQNIRLVAYHGLIHYFRDDRLIFTYRDPKPLTIGWFAFRTVTNHMEIRNFRVHRLKDR